MSAPPLLEPTGRELRAGLDMLTHEARFVVLPALELLAYATDASAKLGDRERISETLREVLTELSAQLAQMGERAGELAQKTAGR